MTVLGSLAEAVMVLWESDRNFLLERAVVRPYERGHYLFNQGDHVICLFAVLEGEVEIFVQNCQARTVIQRKESNALVGEVEWLSKQDRIASAVTVTDSLRGVIRKRAFEQCLETRPELFAPVSHYLAVTVGEMMMRLSTLPLDAYGRLRSCLNSLARQTNGSTVVQGSWTHQQLADLVGCRRETMSRFICALKKGQWIEYESQRIKILRPLPSHSNSQREESHSGGVSYVR
jgi:CRP/FNR family transcriptional regulator, cyclic AMP receptor protein